MNELKRKIIEMQNHSFDDRNYYSDARIHIQACEADSEHTDPEAKEEQGRLHSGGSPINGGERAVKLESKNTLH